MPIDEDAAYRAVRSRDARFDGAFYTGVRTTGIYCRPSCSARTPHRRNVGFYPSSAAAQRAGFRACKMCRPDATPGSPDWNSRADLVGRAVRLIADGVIDRDGVAGLARALGYSNASSAAPWSTALGAPPLALARAQRAQTARILLETTDLAASEIAFAAGFASIRQFNDTIREVFASTPSQLRAARTRPAAEPGAIELRLAYRAPMDCRRHPGLPGRPGGRPGGELRRQHLHRTLRLPHGAGLVSLTPAAGHVAARLRLLDHRDLAAAVARVRRLLDLDADPVGGGRGAGRPPALAAPGRRGGRACARPAPWTASRWRPGSHRPAGVGGRRPHRARPAGRRARPAGLRLPRRTGGCSPTRRCSPAWTRPRCRCPGLAGRSLVALAAAMADGSVVLDAGSDRAGPGPRCCALPGIGPWTADYLLMRALSATRTSTSAPTSASGRPERLVRRAGSTRLATAPWRSYLTHHLWASLADPVDLHPPNSIFPN